MVRSGKQQLELQEHLDYLKQLKIRHDKVIRQTGTYYSMTPEEAACLQNSDRRIKGIVID